MIIRDATTPLELKYDARNNAAAADERRASLQSGRKEGCLTKHADKPGNVRAFVCRAGCVNIRCVLVHIRPTNR